MKFQYSIFFLTLAFTLCTVKYSIAQQPLNQINVVSFGVKSKLPADVSSWGTIPGSILLVAQKSPTVQLQGVKMLIQIKNGSNKVCGNTVQASTTIDVFTIRNFTANELIGMLNPCLKLNANMYTMCVQFFNVDNYPISKEYCKNFLIGDIPITYNTPQNLFPTNNSQFTELNFKAPITFRWVPVLPKPKETVVYKLRVWQLMQGQKPTQAIKANVPIVEKEVTNINQAIITNIIAEPCSPPYLCSFVWNVQALDKDGKAIGKNNGMSELFSLKIK